MENSRIAFDLKAGISEFKRKNPKVKMNQKILAKQIGVNLQWITNIKQKAPDNIAALVAALDFLEVGLDTVIIKNK